MTTIINPRFAMARRRAQRFDYPALDTPAYVRKYLVPRVKIGVLRDPAQPITLSPAIHLPERTRRFDSHDVVGVLALVGFVSLFFIGV